MFGATRFQWADAPQHTHKGPIVWCPALDQQSRILPDSTAPHQRDDVKAPATTETQASPGAKGSPEANPTLEGKKRVEAANQQELGGAAVARGLDSIIAYTELLCEHNRDAVIRPCQGPTALHAASTLVSHLAATRIEHSHPTVPE